MRSQLAVFLLIAGLVQIPRSQAQNLTDSKPREVSLCELLRDPKKFDHLDITIRGDIGSDFEDFSIFDKSCGEPALPGIWLMFGGDVDCPTPSTWNDVGRPRGKDMEFQGVKYSLVKDEEFQNFHKFVTTRKNRKPVYHATATLEGRFFAGHVSKSKNSRMELPGYGHLGCCYLFIIHQVVRVSADKIQ